MRGLIPRWPTVVGSSAIALSMLALAILPSVLETRRVSVELGKEIRPQQLNVSHQLPFFRLPDAFQFALTDDERTIARRIHIPLERFFGERDTLLVNFWATWCPPCIDELPSLELLNRQLESQPPGAELPHLVTISVDETVQPIEQLFKTLGSPPTLVVLLDPDGSFARQLGTTKFPETFWINRNGEILHHWIGPQEWMSHEVLATLSTRRPASGN